MTIVIFGLLLAVAGGYFFWRALTQPYKGFSEPAKHVEIRRGQRTNAILHQLQREGVLRDAFIPLIYMQTLRRNDSLKAGIYEFSKPLAAADVIEKLVRGDVVLRSVTIREGLDRFSVARLFVGEGFGTVEEWRKLTDDPERIRDLAPDATSLEGYLFPDTYKFSPGTSARTIVEAMVQNFRKSFGDQLAFITTGLSLHETVTLASIVETEARRAEERPLVASVYVNRIRKRMLLGADPTVIYALKLAGRWNGNIRKADLQLDSPYNTYKVPGLPPGPIANPGAASLRAAAAPATTGFYYFVARHDGSHAFSTNIDEHNRNVEKYQRQWFRDQRRAAATTNTSTAPQP